MNERILAMLEEYKSLRSESIEAMRSRNSILSLGSAAIGVMFLAGANIIGVNNPSLMQVSISFFIFIAAIPALSILLFFVWLGEAHRMSRVGVYLSELEKRISDEIKQDGEANTLPALHWEGWLRESRKRRQLVYPYFAVVAIFFGAAIFSLLVAFLFQARMAALPGWLIVLLSLLALGGLIYSARWAVVIIRKLA